MLAVLLCCHLCTFTSFVAKNTLQISLHNTHCLHLISNTIYCSNVSSSALMHFEHYLPLLSYLSQGYPVNLSSLLKCLPHIFYITTGQKHQCNKFVYNLLQKGEFQNRCYKKTKHAKFPKKEHLLLLLGVIVTLSEEYSEPC